MATAIATIWSKERPKVPRSPLPHIPDPDTPLLPTTTSTSEPSVQLLMRVQTSHQLCKTTHREQVSSTKSHIEISYAITITNKRVRPSSPSPNPPLQLSSSMEYHPQAQAPPLMQRRGEGALKETEGASTREPHPPEPLQAQVTTYRLTRRRQAVRTPRPTLPVFPLPEPPCVSRPVLFKMNTKERMSAAC